MTTFQSPDLGTTSLHIEIQFICFTDQLRHILNSCGWLIYIQNNYHGILRNTKLITDIQQVGVKCVLSIDSDHMYLSASNDKKKL